MVKITVRPNGPYLIEGDDVLVVDVEGRPYDLARPLKLCRCGHSTKKPFCDATHKRMCWVEDAPLPAPADRPPQ